MSVEQFRRIVEQIRGRATAVSLYYIGDPLVHPDLDEMCRIAYDAGLNVHISTNFSFALTDARIRRIVESGLTHLSVCVDGLTQAKYQMTRVGGRIDRVLDNLKRVCKVRDELRRTYPKVEVQYIKFQHNVDELEAARKLVKSFGVDQVTDFWGALNNYTDGDPDVVTVNAPRKNDRLPQCFWPHSSMVVKYNGDVIPCCNYRIGQQYTHEDDPRILGNIFETSIEEVWNNRQFRDARRLVSNPELVNKEPGLKEHFCYGCPVIFETTEPDICRNSSKFKHEDLYDIGPDGRPVRKAAEVTGLPNRTGTVSRIGLPSGEIATV
jgi:MoaA/NifB/PqqE/SkfB family radical SAM enzyme